MAKWSETPKFLRKYKWSEEITPPINMDQVTLKLYHQIHQVPWFTLLGDVATSNWAKENDSWDHNLLESLTIQLGNDIELHD